MTVKINMFKILCLIGIVTFSARAETSTLESTPLQNALDLLYDLKAELIREQSDDDSKHFQDSKDCIGALSSLAIVETDATAYLDKTKGSITHLQDELAATKGEIEYINESLSFNQIKLQELSGLRCDQSSIFLQNLKDSKEAMNIITDTKKNVDSFFKTQNPELVQITARIGSLVPETVGILVQLTGNTEVDVASLLEDLKTHVTKNVKNFENQELQSARNFADWIVKVNKENIKLNEDLQQKSGYADKLTADIQQALFYNEDATRVQQNAKMMLDSQRDECNHKEQVISEASEQRQREHQILDEAISTFESDIPEIKDYVVARSNVGVDKSSKPERRIYEFKD